MSEEKQLPIYLWMTREEFLTAFAYQLVAWWHPAYFGDEMDEDAREAFFADFDRAMMAAVEDLIHRDFTFTALALNHIGEVVRTQDMPVEPMNQLFIEKMKVNHMPNPINACNVALQEIERRALQIDREPIMAVRDQCERDAAAAAAEIGRDPETLKEMLRWMEENRMEASAALVQAGQKVRAN